MKRFLTQVLGRQNCKQGVTSFGEGKLGGETGREFACLEERVIKLANQLTRANLEWLRGSVSVQDVGQIKNQTTTAVDD